MKKTLFAILMFWHGALGAERFYVYATGGYAFPGSPIDFFECWEKGIGYGGGLGVSVVPTFSIQGNFDYSEFKLNPTTYRESCPDSVHVPIETNIRGGATRMIVGSLGLKFRPLMPIPFAPYFVCEAGAVKKIWDDIMYVTNEGEDTVAVGSFETVPAILAFGGGLEFSYTKLFDVFIEGGYRVCLTVTNGWTGYAPLKLGVRVKF